MRFNKNNGEELNDGVLFYGTKKTIRNEEKKIVGTEFIEDGRLYYKIKSFRYDDYRQYFGIEKSIDLKVKTYCVRDIDKAHIIKIDEDYFDITSMDKIDKYMYLYLSKKGSEEFD